VGTVSGLAWFVFTQRRGRKPEASAADAVSTAAEPSPAESSPAESSSAEPSPAES